MGFKHVFAGACLVAAAMASPLQAATISGAVGATGQSEMTYRLGLGLDWDKTWLQSSVGHLTGYWDLGFTYWEGGDHTSARQSISFAPVFVYEFAGGDVVPFVEAGIGVSLFSDTRVGSRDLGSAFNFEDRLGLGLKIAQTHRVGVRMIHYSNAGISEPNDGIESYSLFYSMNF